MRLHIMQHSTVSLIIVCVLLLTCTACKKKEQKAPPQPPAVEVVQVMQKNVPVYSEWVGSADGSVNARIRPQVTGYLIAQRYHEGDYVKKGQLLFEIDPRPFQAALNQAKGELARQEANFATAKANLARVLPLAAQNALSQKDRDDAIGAERSAAAAVTAARAAVEKAKLDLGFTKITSPIHGIAGLAKAQIGDLVSPGQTDELTTVSTVDPIKVYIQLSEQEYLHAAEMGKKGVHQPLKLILADGSVFPYEGKFAFTDRQIDPRTGTLKVATLFKNPERVLRPGQFARVRMTSMRQNAMVIPQRAVTELQGHTQVAVVGPGNIVHIRTVAIGERADNLAVVTKGLTPGEWVVIEGTQKAKEGMKVSPLPYHAPAPSSHPQQQSR